MTEDTEAAPATPKPRPARGRRSGLAVVAVGVAVLALVVAAFSVWHLHRFTRAAAITHAQDTATIANLQSELTAGSQQAETGNQRLGRIESRLDDLHTANQNLDHRLTNLETAYAALSGQQQTSHDTLLLNDAEMLLRTGQQRYELFHDTTGALKAYTQALAVLAQVQNPAYAPVSASATTERDALAAAAPPSRQTALDTLSALRGKLASLPLATPGAPGSSSTPSSTSGFWSHVGRAFGGIVKVSRDNSSAATFTNARFARQTLALDLAQAQEAMLAFDDGTYRAALERADAVLAAQFEASDASVKDARQQIANLLAKHATGPAPQLGGALAQLQSLRAGQSGANAPAAPPPSAAASSGSTKR
ncbi:MAG TPA: uroporphyrinogen-III C-methyltransferase [Rhodanobacteraceae bacterium]